MLTKAQDDPLGLTLPSHMTDIASCDLARYVSAFSTELLGAGIQEKDLLRQLHLHLYRFQAENVDLRILNDEIERLINKLAKLRTALRRSIENSLSSHTKLRHTTLRLIDSSFAQSLHQVHHYLGSSRGDGIHLGLYTDIGRNGDAQLLCMVTLSPFDLLHMRDALPQGIAPEQVIVLSRLLAFRWSPRNTISFTLGRVFSWLKVRLPHLRLLITYLDPNLGFRGTVYKSSNWVLFGRERKRRYLYLDSDYVTDRQMIREYGTADFVKLHSQLGDRVSTSTQYICPLEIYAYFLDEATRKKYSAGFNFDFTPIPKLVGQAQ